MTFQFIGQDLFIGEDVHCHPAPCMGTYYVEDKKDNFLFIVDDFGNLVHQPLTSAKQRHLFRQTLH